MKTTRLIPVLAAIAMLASSNLYAADWVRAGTALTETVAEGESSWVLKISVSGTNISVTAVTTVGSGTTLDFSGAITDAGDTHYGIISLNGFSGKTTIMSVVLPPGLQTFGRDAFLNCTGLETVTPLLPDTLTELGQRTFAGCTSLRGDPVFPAHTVTSTYTWTTGTWGWFNGSKITSCDMSAATMTEIVGSSFANCSLLEWVKLPQGVKTFGSNCFDNCPVLESITPFLPVGITSIGQAAFYRCPKLTGDLVLAGDAPITLTHHNNNGFGLFQGSKITSVTMTAPITATCGQMFYGCTSLTNAVLPDTLQNLYGGDFRGCTALQRVTPFLPPSLKTLGTDSFRGCSSLAIPLVISGTNNLAIVENGNANNSFNGSAILSATISAPMTDIGGTYNTGRNANGALFAGATHLGEVLFPETVQYVRATTFSSCTSLTNVVFAGDLPNIASTAFNSVTDYGPRLYVPRFNETWEAFMATNVNFAAMNATLETKYRAKYPEGLLPNGCLTISSRHVWISDKQYEGGNALYIAGTPTRIGAVEPDYGLVTNVAAGSSVVCTAPATAMYQGSRYACIGSVLDTEVADRVFANPVTNAGTTRVVSQTGDEVKRLVWLWGPDGFALDTSAAGQDHGSVTCSPENTGPYASNTVVTATATADAGCVFLGWTGDVPDGFTTNATITVTMDSAKACHPLYAGPWIYNGSNQITDGNWVLTVSQTSGTEELSVSAVVSVENETVLHLGLGVEDAGGTPYEVVSLTGFANRSGLRFVYLPPHLRVLGKLAFHTCTALERVEPLLPPTLTEIGQCAFALCLNLTGDVVFPSHAVASPYIWSNDTWGWFNATKITSCDMSGATMTEIVGFSFNDCKQLKWVKLPQGVKTYGTSCFTGCSELESITPFLPYGVTSIGAAAFMNCPKLAGDIVLAGDEPLTLTHHNNNGYGIFQGCSSLTSATITAPATLTCGQMFLNCSSLKSIVLPDTLERLYGSDFSGCSALTEIILPESLDTIGGSTFNNCTALTNVYFKGTVPTTRAANAFNGQTANKIRVFVPSDDAAWTQDFYNDNVTPMDETLRAAYRAVFPTGKLPRGQFTWSTKMWFCTWDPHASCTIIILR